MKSILYIIVFLAITSFLPIEEARPPCPAIEVKLHYVMNEQLTIIQEYTVIPDSTMNLTDKVPVYYEQFYVTVKTK